jgi:hypothetical protein
VYVAIFILYFILQLKEEFKLSFELLNSKKETNKILLYSNIDITTIKKTIILNNKCINKLSVDFFRRNKLYYLDALLNFHN